MASLGKTGWKKGGGGVSFYVRGQLKCTEVWLGTDEEPTESVWVRIKESLPNLMKRIFP